MVLTFDEEDAVLAGSPDPRERIQVQISDGRVAIAALLMAPKQVQSSVWYSI